MIDTFENRAALQTPASLAEAMRDGKILEAKAVMCDSKHNLIVDLKFMRGLIPREGGALGIKDGTVDMIATDHAPHSAEEKSRGLEKSLMGVVGLETAFPVLYTFLVKTGIITLEKLTELMAINPRKRFGIEDTGDFCVYDLGAEYVINPEEFLSMGRSTPFEGVKVSGRNLITVCGGKTVWQSER